MKSNQHQYIAYIEQFAERNKIHIWLGGSFLHGTYTRYSDVDISVFCDEGSVHELIYGYGRPIFISSTINPEGILIVIYEDGVAVDLEVIGLINEDRSVCFHREDIKSRDYRRNETIWKTVSLRSDLPYQMSRLFHRSLIKYLSGKRKSGVSIAMEIVSYLESDLSVDETNYKDGIMSILDSFEKRYPLDEKYRDLLLELQDKVQ